MKITLPRKKRISFMASLPPPSGGEANVTKTFFESLPAFGYELQLIDVGQRDSRFFSGKLSFYNLCRMFQHLGKLIESNLLFQPSFVNLMFAYSAISKFALFTLISKAMGVRVLGQLHDPWIDQEYEKCGEFNKKFIRWVFRLPDGWVVLGEGWKKFMLRASVLPEKIYVIANAVKREFVVLAQGLEYPQELHPPVILFTGTVGVRKGIDLLLDALTEIEVQGIPFKVQIVGAGEQPGERENLIEQYRQSLKSDSFEFIGHKEGQELINLFTHANIFVLPSRAENLPVSMLEAMACGLPVVVSRVGAVEEVIKDNENGLLVYPGRADKLKVALVSLLQDPALRLRLGQKARQTILKNHVPSQVGKKMHAFIEQLMDLN